MNHTPMNHTRMNTQFTHPSIIERAVDHCLNSEDDEAATCINELSKMKGDLMDATSALQKMRDAYGNLHDALSDMIEGGRLVEADIPDDYTALVAMLIACNAADDQAKKALGT